MSILKLMVGVKKFLKHFLDTTLLGQRRLKPLQSFGKWGFK